MVRIRPNSACKRVSPRVVNRRHYSEAIQQDNPRLLTDTRVDTFMAQEVQSDDPRAAIVPISPESAVVPLLLRLYRR